MRTGALILTPCTLAPEKKWRREPLVIASKNLSVQAPWNKFSAKHQAPRHNMCARNISAATEEGRAPSQRAHNHWAPREDEGTFSEHRQSPGTKISLESAFSQMRVPANTWPALLSAHAAHTPACSHSLPLCRRDKLKKEKMTQQSNLNGGSFFS